MPEQSWQDLLEENKSAIETMILEGNLNSTAREFEIRAAFRDKETALNARLHVKNIGSLPKNAVVVAANNFENESKRDLVILFRSRPNPELITNAEWWMRDAVEKFDGEELGWRVFPE